MAILYLVYLVGAKKTAGAIGQEMTAPTSGLKAVCKEVSRAKKGRAYCLVRVLFVLRKGVLRKGVWSAMVESAFVSRIVMSSINSRAHTNFAAVHLCHKCTWTRVVMSRVPHPLALLLAYPLFRLKSITYIHVCHVKSLHLTSYVAIFYFAPLTCFSPCSFSASSSICSFLLAPSCSLPVLRPSSALHESALCVAHYPGYLNCMNDLYKIPGVSCLVSHPLFMPEHSAFLAPLSHISPYVCSS